MFVSVRTISHVHHQSCIVVHTRTYLDSLAEEINDRLQEHGLVTIAELAKIYDLPGDFISQVDFTENVASWCGSKKKSFKLCHSIKS